MKRNSDQLEDPIDVALTVSQDRKKKKFNDHKNASQKPRNADLEIQGSPIFANTEKSADNTIDKFLSSLTKTNPFHTGFLKDSPILDIGSKEPDFNLLGDSFGFPPVQTESINRKLELSFKDIRNNRKALKQNTETDLQDFSKKIESKLEIVTSNSSDNSLRDSGEQSRVRPQTTTLSKICRSSGIYRVSRKGFKTDLNQRIQTDPSYSDNQIEPSNDLILKDLSGYYPPVLKVSCVNSERQSSKKLSDFNTDQHSFDSHNFGISFTLGSDQKILSTSNLDPSQTPTKQAEEEVKVETMKGVSSVKNSVSKNSVTKIVVQKRKSVSASKSPVQEVRKRDENVRKSFSKAPQVIDPSLYRELQDENDKLKKENQRKQKEAENLKREKEVLLRKVKSIETERKELEDEKEKAMQILKERELKFLRIQEELIKSENQRSLIHNHLQEFRGNLRIFCRVKPLPFNQKNVVQYPEKSLISSSSQVFHTIEIGSGSKKLPCFFDRVFDETSSNETVFNEIVPFVQSAIDGNKVCILAYGQTGSGKTYTMEGPNLAESDSINDNSGILPRAVAFIFQEVKRLEMMGITIEIKLSCLEIYNESLTDLLAEPTSLNSSLASSNSSQISEKEGKLVISCHNGKVIVNNLTWASIKDTQQLFGLVTKASKARAVDKTAWNERSSRSHCIYRIKLCNHNGNDGLLTIVDLAGSEKSESKSLDKVSVSESAHSKKIQTEAGHINKSLTTLGRIIRLISEKNSSNIPYRESKLTRLLQDSLGGNAKTLMFINICPSEENYTQSKESLKFSSKATI